MNKTKSELEKIARDTNTKLTRIRDAERVVENKNLIGKTFRYWNSGGDRKWWLYAKVVGMSPDGQLKLFTFEMHHNTRISIETERIQFSMANYGYVRCQPKIFNAAWRAVQKKIAGVRP